MCIPKLVGHLYYETSYKERAAPKILFRLLWLHGWHQIVGISKTFQRGTTFIYLYLLVWFPSHFSQLHDHLESSWQVFADKSASSMQTTGNHSKLLATKAITKKFLLQHPLCAHYCLQTASLLPNKYKLYDWRSCSCGLLGTGGFHVHVQA